MSDIEFELKKRFAELRAAEESVAPTYQAVRDRGQDGVELHRTAPMRGRWIAPALLAAAAAAVAVVWTASRTGGGPFGIDARLRDSTALSIQWTMPTDGLLESAQRTLQTPAFSASVLDAASVPIPGTPFKGD